MLRSRAACLLALLPIALVSLAPARAGGARLVVSGNETASASRSLQPQLLADLPDFDWFTSGDQANELYGSSVVAAGDVNGDGYGDLLVGAPLYDNGQPDEGRAFLFLGGPGGYSTTPDWMAESNLANSQFGAQVAPAGDVNGDGYADVIVSAYQYANQTGRAYGFYGSPSGLHTSPDWIVTGPQHGGAFAIALGTAGDVNGDGYEDVVIGEPFHQQAGLFATGLVHLYLGSASGLSTAEAETLYTGQAGTTLGTAVATAGDVNGDGFDDVIAGGSTLGQAYVYLGSPSGLQGPPTILSAPRDFGAAVATAGDVNGDGYAEVIVGAPGRNFIGASGYARVYAGSSSGIQTSYLRELTRNTVGDEFGASVAPAGDVNGDGLADVVIGAPSTQSGYGGAFAYVSDANAPDPALFFTIPLPWITAGSHHGACVGTAGDADGDGFGDVVVGANSYNGGSGNEGRVYLYRGSPLGPAQPVTTALPGSATGEPLRLSTGDVNGDGYTDLLEGDPAANSQGGVVQLFLGSRTGIYSAPARTLVGSGTSRAAEVAFVGDVNGDGYEDALVGSPGYQDGGRTVGRADLYYGGPAGLGVAPNWSAIGTAADSAFGSAVTGVGDLNGDGYADAAVGDSLYTSGGIQGGLAAVYYGSPLGLTNTPSWTALGAHAGESLGAAIAAAGDVNGDGFSDLLIGSPHYREANGHGTIALYLGSANGLASAASWSDSANVPGDYFGQGLAPAGDVNGDGFSDVLVTSAYAGRFSYAHPGVLFFYVGSATPPYLSANTAYVDRSLLDGRPSPLAVRAGDVDGDGLDDILIGEPGTSTSGANSQEGRVMLFGWSGEFAIRNIDQSQGLVPGTQRGRTVAQGGDANGDGFSDPLFTDWSSPGVAAVEHFPGGGGFGIDRAARQARADLSSPLALLGRSPDASSFALRARARSAAGRSRVRLEWQTAPLGQAFSAIGRGPFASTAAPAPSLGSFVDVSQVVTGLTLPRPYCWQLRISGRSPFFPHTPWLSMAGNATRESDLRTILATTAVDRRPKPVASGLALTAGPNPGRGGFDLSFRLARPGTVRLGVFDVLGRRIARLVDDSMAAGGHTLRWEAPPGLEGGVYYLHLEAEGQSASAKVVLLGS